MLTKLSQWVPLRFCSLLLEYLFKSHDPRYSIKPRRCSLLYINFRATDYVITPHQVLLSKTAKHWDGFVSHCTSKQGRYTICFRRFHHLHILRFQISHCNNRFRKRSEVLAKYRIDADVVGMSTILATWKQGLNIMVNVIEKYVRDFMFNDEEYEN